MMVSRKFKSIVCLTGLVLSTHGCGGDSELDSSSGESVSLIQTPQSGLQDYEEEASELESAGAQEDEGTLPEDSGLVASGEAEEVEGAEEEAAMEDPEGTTGDNDSEGEGSLPDETLEVNEEETEVNEEETEVNEEETEVNEENSGVMFMPLSEEGDVVSFVEIDRYMGRWYEIATTPSFQQAACFGTAADYVFNEEEDWVDVTNTCNTLSATGFLQQIEGRAELDDLETQAKLLVFFFNQGSPYWVVALDGREGPEQYQWAVVSVPGSQTMWLLSRTPQMEPGLRESIEAHLEERGFPVDTLMDTPQPE